ncbi:MULTISPECIES: nucleotidyl transferase AbiEii/AbiGii toxin family protein [unclassified Facklamia]|uniref:nucleotidyl transferase AbiEii/AbiGii toxin family protein n=1 Tax=Aerococcaceae TaxID=186827 RepID=UPI0013BD6945|nr:MULTISPECIES: nucleotidyl transferase AbiEii/AbiGii toxin family protein [unclassified Facklamia]MBS4461249.1 nucleotidyl transferase AbiEii/AbiGii toxin family protein [Aerococcaceae bacterium zg-B36]NEW65170.1 nucleotidyl transferase AbiEii/AbiGii toxin family protein [Facklamia sp. 252]NEW68561.1 nucleotidyl transferase AbiEii/AbiGii toxin family protein [Facklamia sp. 253]QQD65973.1 nucleotidyl transferase AbiEii/AbiGii toxin family protein [Aerococcaceae bacterium zg-252]
MIKTSKQLKDLINNLSRIIDVNPQILIRKYMMERFLERLSKSEYRSYFILKGGMLVSNLLGDETRSTMDIDTTVKGIDVSMDKIGKIISEICSMEIEDKVDFRLKGISEILDEADYSGLRFSMEAKIDKAVIPLKLDISTGDIITPKEINYAYSLMFENRTIPIFAYPIETILAEKLETIISKTITNTRMRDFYDIHVLIKYQAINRELFKEALFNTANQRGTLTLLSNAENIILSLEEDMGMRIKWERYSKKYSYAKEYVWEDVIGSVRRLFFDAELDIENIALE